MKLESNKLGKCVLCSDRVFKTENYVESTDGYAHIGCLIEKKVSSNELEA